LFSAVERLSFEVAFSGFPVTFSLAAISSTRRNSLPDLDYNIASGAVTPNHLYTHIKKNEAHSAAAEKMSSQGEIAAN
jgi:hypothetical protein